LRPTKGGVVCGAGGLAEQKPQRPTLWVARLCKSSCGSGARCRSQISDVRSKGSRMGSRRMDLFWSIHPLGRSYIFRRERPHGRSAKVQFLHAAPPPLGRSVGTQRVAARRSTSCTTSCTHLALPSLHNLSANPVGLGGLASGSCAGWQPRRANRVRHACLKPHLQSSSPLPWTPHPHLPWHSARLASARLPH
jgi:hypothetical protein